MNILEKFIHQLTITTLDHYGIGNFVTKHEEFEGKVGQKISIFSFRTARGITTQGLKYPLENDTLEWAVKDGLSNEIVSNPVTISIKSGILFVYCLE